MAANSFKDYFAGLNRFQKLTLARQCETSIGVLNVCACGARPLPRAVAILMDHWTGGRLPLWQTRPDVASAAVLFVSAALAEHAAGRSARTAVLRAAGHLTAGMVARGVSKGAERDNVLPARDSPLFGFLSRLSSEERVRFAEQCGVSIDTLRTQTSGARRLSVRIALLVAHHSSGGVSLARLRPEAHDALVTYAKACEADFTADKLLKEFYKLWSLFKTQNIISK